jgi:hypothetical protein
MLQKASRSAALARLSPAAATSALRRLSLLVQCGLEDVHSRLPTALPLPALSPPNSSISLISCGLFHAAAVTSAGPLPHAPLLVPIIPRYYTAQLAQRAPAPYSIPMHTKTSVSHTVGCRAAAVLGQECGRTIGLRAVVH